MWGWIPDSGGLSLFKFKEKQKICQKVNMVVTVAGGPPPRTSGAQLSFQQGVDSQPVLSYLLPVASSQKHYLLLSCNKWSKKEICC